MYNYTFLCIIIHPSINAKGVCDIYEKIETAIAYFTWLKSTLPKTDIDGLIACNTAISLLPKEKPHKPYLLKSERFKYTEWYCRNCMQSVNTSHSYCPDCGQKIDWFK